jgi:hypothetical protein
MVPTAIALGLLPLAMAGTGSVGARPGTLPGVASVVTAIGDLHGFKLAYDKANPDGSVTAVLRRGRESVIYLGAAGSRLSVGLSSKVVVVKVKGRKERVTRHGLLVGASNPTAPGNGTTRSFGPAGFAATRSVIGDQRGTGLPRKLIALIATADRKLTRGVPDITSSGGPGHMSAWCIATIFASPNNTNPISLTANGCDVRTVLQQQSGNNFIADDMSAQATCNQQCSDILSFNIHVDYTFTADNTVNILTPNSKIATGCTPRSVSFSYYGFGFSYADTACDGAMYPQGVDDATNVGAYWTSNCVAGQCSAGTNSQLALEEVAEDHAKASTNPDTYLYVYIVYDNYGASFNAFAKCRDTDSCV